MNTLPVAFQVTMEIGEERGMVRGIEKVAENALLKGMTIEIIREITGLPLQRIRELQAQIAQDVDGGRSLRL